MCVLLSVFLSDVAGPVLSPLLRQDAETDQIADKTLSEHPHFRQITIISLKVRWGSCHGHTGCLAPLSRKRMFVTLESLAVSAFKYVTQD